jgi:hypothetical protein
VEFAPSRSPREAGRRMLERMVAVRSLVDSRKLSTTSCVHVLAGVRLVEDKAREAVRDDSMSSAVEMVSALTSLRELLRVSGLPEP